jgi:protein gp37
MHPQWARDLRDQCVAAGVSYFFKQWGEWMPFDSPDELAGVGSDRSPVCLVKPDGRAIRPYALEDSPGQQMVKVGKKAAGRLLDGRTWDEFPRVPVEATP